MGEAVGETAVGEAVGDAVGDAVGETPVGAAVVGTGVTVRLGQGCHGDARSGGAHQKSKLLHNRKDKQGKGRPSARTSDKKNSRGVWCVSPNPSANPSDKPFTPQ